MIYILEDDESIRKLVVYGLESQGFTVEGFALPSAFHRAMERALPELVLLDLMLPEEDGLHILRDLRASAATRTLPVILLTARDTEYDRVIGLDRLKAIHTNDSMNVLGAHKDRHEKIGKGKIGLEAFRRIVNHPQLRELPFYLETPCDLQGYKEEIALVRSLRD